jgi:hypothetical protein
MLVLRKVKSEQNTEEDVAKILIRSAGQLAKDLTVKSDHFKI